MFKTAVFILFLTLGFVTFADKCQYCPSTAPLYKVDGMSYCNKHYCSKHKAIHKERACRQCELISLIERRKAVCLFCDNKKDLVIVKYGQQEFNLLCPNHYCQKHQQILVDRESGSAMECPVCRKIKKAEKDVAELTKQRAVLIRKLDEIYKTMATPLKGLFGIKLGAPTASIKTRTVNGETHIRSFTPSKTFRKFESYFVEDQNGVINSIMAIANFSQNDAAESEFIKTIDIMDRKYGAIRRGEMTCRGPYDRCVFYDFSCDAGTTRNPKQRISVVKTRQADNGKCSYQITIVAFFAADVAKKIDEQNQKDLDAL